MKKVTLDETWLQNGLPGVTKTIAQCFSEAASVCWDCNGHGVTVTLTVQGAVSQTFVIAPQPVTEKMRGSYADLQEAVEWAACAVAFLIVVEETPYTVVSRSRKGTGFDYWLGDKKAKAPLFQDKARLEVSGILTGSDSDITRRMKTKQAQVSQHQSKLSAYVVVAEFGQPKAQLESV